MTQATLESREGLRRTVLDRLSQDHRLDSSHIAVELRGTTVRLTGTVPSYAERRYAAEDALYIPGVTEVENRIAVAYPAAYTVPNDEQIRDHITRIIRWNSRLRLTNPERIRVLASCGAVTLEGSVDAYWEKVKAEELASEVQGVVHIDNKIAVVPTEKYQDEAIARDILSALEKDVHVDVTNVNVTVASGEVTLSGSVPDKRLRRAAAERAAHVPGVVHVEDNLIVME